MDGHAPFPSIPRRETTLLDLDFGRERRTLENFVRRHGVVAPPDKVARPARVVSSTCDVCGAFHGVVAVKPGMLRQTAAPWITAVCPGCLRRLGVEQQREP
jgi:hypothetical protein